mmetsp:Transcript_35074/g.80772  ORF Transcript_35074/g.80772 Transcript_35074/m.80772 type:complete len:224 (-) Transcript_35074:402-1073(-)
MHHVLEAFAKLTNEVLAWNPHILERDQARVACVLSQFREALCTGHPGHLRLDDQERDAFRPLVWIRHTGHNRELRISPAGDPHLPAIHQPSRTIWQLPCSAKELAQVTADFRLGHRYSNDGAAAQLWQPPRALLFSAAVREIRQDHVVAQVHEQATTAHVFQFLANYTVVPPVQAKPTTACWYGQGEVEPLCGHLGVQSTVNNALSLVFCILWQDMFLREIPE